MNRDELIVLLILIGSLQSCTIAKTAGKDYTKDPAMEIGNDTGKNFQNYVNSIREGSIPAGTSKSSGGCGCN